MDIPLRSDVHVELPEAEATIVDPYTRTIKHVSVSDIKPDFIDSLNLENWYYDIKRTFFYASEDETKKSWIYRDRDAEHKFYGVTYILGGRVNTGDREFFFPPRIHQRYISNYIFFCD